ncbi:hypothetical protein, partial [Agrobacterium pusense]|uniref:hypothetical protein n=1 Tax=Agrobacterium pusense TaxID=648995 RepID=UPI002FDE657F
VEQPKFTQVPIVDENGNPVTVITRVKADEVDGDLDAHEGFVEVQQQQYFGVPVMEEFEVDVEEQVIGDDFVYSIRHTEFIMALLAVAY